MPVIEESLGEDFFEALGTIVKDGANVTIDEKFGYERTAENSVADVIFAESAAILGGEGVLVDPDAIGAAKLLVDEAVGRVPDGNFAAPADGNAVKFEAVLDFGALKNLATRGKKLEVQPRRSELLEIGSLGKEVENFDARVREEETVVEFEKFHERSFMSCLARRETADWMNSGEGRVRH